MDDSILRPGRSRKQNILRRNMVILTKIYIRRAQLEILSYAVLYYLELIL